MEEIEHEKTNQTKAEIARDLFKSLYFRIFIVGFVITMVSISFRNTFSLLIWVIAYTVGMWLFLFPLMKKMSETNI